MLSMQIYAALPPDTDEDHPGAFHRAIFVFVSPTASGLTRPGGVRVLRCQLPRDNAYYDSKPSSARAPPACSPEAHEFSAQRDAWKVLDSEQAQQRHASLQSQQRSAGSHESHAGAEAGPALLKELEIIVEPADGASQVSLDGAGHEVI